MRKKKKPIINEMFGDSSNKAASDRKIKNLRFDSDSNDESDENDSSRSDSSEEDNFTG